MKTRKLLVLIPVILTSLTILSASAPSDDAKLQKFISQHIQQLEPKRKAAALADWNANATGEKEYYDQSAVLELEIERIYSNRDDFSYLKTLKQQGSITDSLLKRQLVILYDDYLRNQIDPTLQKAIIDKQAVISEQFNTFRGKIGDRELSDNELYGILKSEDDVAKRKQAWEAGKQVGRKVALLIIELVKLRNQAAKQLGFDSYYQMSITTSEQDVAEVTAIFDQLKQMTDAPFRSAKSEIDAALAAKFKVKPEDLRPWHYNNPFFQEVSETGQIDLDRLYQGKDIIAIAQDFYAGIGLPIDDIIKNSDLYPRKGKYQHAFCADIDRLGDVRTMCNIVPSQEWMGTMLHEMGHGVYDKYVNRDLPYLLRGASHSFLTEAIAELMGRQASNADWLQAMVGVDKNKLTVYKTTLDDNLRLSQLVFSRWSQVMERFERKLYENPDQDLNKLWWDLVEEYQLVKRPENRNEPDWAAKIHIALYPCYYHNYILGEMAASQILHTIVREIEKQDKFTEISFANHPGIGKYLKEKVFKPGASLGWEDLLKYATGEGLNARYFAEEFVGK
ncbi:MAG: M2 family metallopeptidase [bacterium]|nr:M2 family metallopeptidase [bacterium]